MAKRFLTPIGIVNLASDPVSGSEGEIYYNSTDDILKIYVNGSWTPIEGGGGAAINVSASAPVAPEEGDAWFDNTDGAFYVYDGSFWVEAAQPLNAKLTFWTEDQNGNLLPDIDNIYSIGASAYRVKDLYLGASSLYIQSYSDASQNIQISMGDGNKLNIDGDELLTYSTASSTYLTIQNASATYATQVDLDNIDLTSTINTASAAAVNFLVDGAPEALNTLNELAAALEDNADVLNLYLTQSSASSIYATQAELASFSTETFLIKAEAYTAESGDVVFVNSASGAYTITLPPTPTLGDKVRIIDLANNAVTNNITIGRNSENIDGVASNFIIDINNAGVELIYTNSTYGWRTLND